MLCLLPTVLSVVLHNCHRPFVGHLLPELAAQYHELDIHQQSPVYFSQVFVKMVRINLRKIGRASRHVVARVSRVGVHGLNAVPGAGEALAGAGARVMDEYQVRSSDSPLPIFAGNQYQLLARDGCEAQGTQHTRTRV